MNVLRLCSVFEPPPGTPLTGRGDPIGGMQNHTAALSRALDARGVTQTVLTSRPPGTPATQPVGQRSTVVRVRLPVPYCRQMYGVAAARSWPSVTGHVDLVHAHLGEDLAVLPIARRVAAARRVPLVMTVHTSLRHTLPVTDARSAVLKWVGGLIERRAAAAADAVITLTPRLAGLLVGDGVRPDRVHVIPSGVERAVFDTVGADPFPDVPRPRVVFVGRLHRQKQVDTLVRAAASMTAAGVHVLIVGDGPDRAWLEGLADPRVVHFTGFVAHDLVPAVLQHADVFVMPSRYEELGSVLIEAMHCGLPIVASDTGGIPDVITDGVTGRLVPPGSPTALARAVDDLLRDRELAARLGQAAREQSARYDWSVLADQVLDVYRDLLGARVETAV